MSERGVVVRAVAAGVPATTAHPLPLPLLLGGSHHDGAPPRDKVAAIRMQKSQKCSRYGRASGRSGLMADRKCLEQLFLPKHNYSRLFLMVFAIIPGSWSIRNTGFGG
jgi:hypothetical protein